MNMHIEQRPIPALRLETENQGIVLSHGDGPDE